MSLADKDKATERKKRFSAIGASAGAVALLAASPILGALALVPAGYLVKDWFSFRAKRGMRF